MDEETKMSKQREGGGRFMCESLLRNGIGGGEAVVAVSAGVGKEGSLVRCDSSQLTAADTTSTTQHCLRAADK